eukprot:CAMPEP_0204325082 /NCGR_PEP_ID=MMETSP0469-20131031/10749_1 /ASSEMBLY_ACC=CAM_ASM_000384 /TAXON_ID=2969 /ORGANISM="Oxyrrhis marina" /LENGTH=45 /DNA_ID= /DNA_START= /DNA_END= /DNA_ORIENTATION=
MACIIVGFIIICGITAGLAAGAAEAGTGAVSGVVCFFSSGSSPPS